MQNRNNYATENYFETALYYCNVSESTVEAFNLFNLSPTEFVNCL